MLLIGVAVFLASCMLFSGEFADKRRSELAHRSIENVCAELAEAGISGETDAEEACRILSASPEIDEILECKDDLLTVRLTTGLVCYIMLDFEQAAEASELDTSDISRFRDELASLSGTSRAGDCPPWTSEKVLVVRAVSEMSDVGKLRMQQTVNAIRQAGYAVDYLQEAEFTPATLGTLSDYGFVFLVGHGGPLVFQTGLKATAENINAYDVIDHNEALAPLIYYGDDGPKGYISFTLKYDFPFMDGTLIYLNGCNTASEGFDYYTLGGELLDSGASVVIGNLGRIRKVVAAAVVGEICEELFLERSTVADAIEAARSRYSHIALTPGYSFVSLNAAPVPEIRSSRTSGMRPLLVEFSAEGSQDPDDTAIHFEWDFGDGSNADGQDVSHVFETSGLFTVELSVSDPCGLSSSTRVDVQVDPAPCDVEHEPPTATLNCGKPSQSGDVSFSWSGSDNCSTSIQYQYGLENHDVSESDWTSETSKSYRDLSSGTYRFCVKAKDEKGNVSAEECCSITVTRDPCASDSQPPTVSLNCGTPSSSGNVSFTWSGSDNCSASLQYQYKLTGRDTTWSSWSSSTSKSYTGLSAGTYTFCVKAKDEKGNVSAEECCSITVMRDPCASDSQPPTVSLNCGTPSQAGDVSFSWSGSDNCSTSLQYQYKLTGRDTTWSPWSSSTSKSYTGLSAGTYTFCVKAKDERGNVSAEKCCSITVEQDCVNNPQVWTDKSSYCVGDRITVYMQLTAPGTISLLDEKEYGYTKYLIQNQYYNAGTHTLSGDVDGPTGPEHLTLTVTACGSTRSDATTFQVEDCSSPGDLVSFCGYVTNIETNVDSPGGPATEYWVCGAGTGDGVGLWCMQVFALYVYCDGYVDPGIEVGDSVVVAGESVGGSIYIDCSPDYIRRGPCSEWYPP